MAEKHTCGLPRFGDHIDPLFMLLPPLLPILQPSLAATSDKVKSAN